MNNIDMKALAQPFKQFDVTITFSVSVPAYTVAREWCDTINEKVMGAAAKATADANAATTKPVVVVVERAQ